MPEDPAHWQEMSINLLERAQTKAAAQRSAAATRYRELLEHFDRPAPGDEEQLAGVMQVLGVSVHQIEEHAGLVQHLAQCEELAGGIEGLEVELVDAHKALTDAQREAEQRRAKFEQSIVARLEPLQAARSTAEASLNAAKQARGELALLRDEWLAIEQGVAVEDARAARLAEQRAAGGYAIHGPGPRRGVVRGPEVELSP